MTKVDLCFDLAHALDEKTLEKISDAHSVYGIEMIRFSPGMDSIIVQYDASRLTPLDVEARFRSFGIPIRRPSRN